MTAPPVREWDAASYQRVSVPHEEWAKALMERLPLAGTETVLDAGCGTGRATRMLVERLPEGKVVAVDGSAAMVEKVREVLRSCDEAFVADLTALHLERPVDAVVSSAVFHWIADHEALFSRLRAALRAGGRLEAQCGGAGNIDALRETAKRLAGAQPFAPYVGEIGELWNYAGAEQTEARLRAAGFAGAECWLQPWDVTPEEPAEFLRTVCLGPYVDALPEELGNAFVEAVLAAEDEPLTMHYVRLNISAVAA
jgi:trans-aconitate 2-methyltransferase